MGLCNCAMGLESLRINLLSFFCSQSSSVPPFLQTSLWTVTQYSTECREDQLLGRFLTGKHLLDTAWRNEGQTVLAGGGG
jgi:hypothetical protein